MQAALIVAFCYILKPHKIMFPTVEKIPFVYDQKKYMF